MAAAAAVLTELWTPELCRAHNAKGDWLRERINELSQAHGAPCQAHGCGSLVNISFRARPLFEAYAACVRHVGPTGAGMQLKLINNLLFAAQVRLAEDAFRLAGDAGFDAATVTEVLGRCSAASRALAIIGEGGNVAANAARMRFYVDKDVAVAVGIAATAGLDLGLVGEVARGAAAPDAA